MPFTVDNYLTVYVLILNHKTNLRTKMKKHHLVIDLMRLLNGDLRKLVFSRPVVADLQVRMPTMINPLVKKPIE